MNQTRIALTIREALFGENPQSVPWRIHVESDDGYERRVEGIFPTDDPTEIILQEIDTYANASLDNSRPSR